MKIAVKYAFFAGLATLANIGTQYLFLALYTGAFALILAMMAGTLTGLVVKYVLDRRYIFYFPVDSLREDAGRFILYSAMGILTTLVFWGTELLFDACLQGENAKYAGALLGLAGGYAMKYQLDKRFVFGRSSERPRETLRRP